jgi:aldose 1-epimerase
MTPAAPDPRIIELTAGETVASFATGAGMVGCSLRHRGEELLGLSGGLRAYLEQGSTFGIPILYPWANRLGAWRYEAAGRTVELDRSSPLLHGEEHALPIHGALAATSDWTVTESSAGALDAEIDFGDHADLLAVFPFPHRLALEIRLRDGELRITTSVTAYGAAVPVSFGFHPYLSPPGEERERWWIELPPRTALALDELGLPTGAAEAIPPEGFALGERTFDDLFAVPASPARFAVTGGGRRVTIELTSGYSYAQVFAPPDQQVICFEPMTAPVDALRSHHGLGTVAPGETARASFALTVEDR